MRTLFAGILLTFEVLAGTLATPSQDRVRFVDSSAYFDAAVKRPTAKRYDPQIEALIRQMTVEEKVGQMTQLTVDMVTTGHDQNIEIDPQKLDKAINKYGVGSILNVSDQALSLEHWYRIIEPIQEAARKT